MEEKVKIVAIVEEEDGEVREAEFAGFVMEGEEEKKDKNC